MREKNRNCKQEKNPFVYYSFCFFDVMSCPTNEHYKYLENLIHYLVNM